MPNAWSIFAIGREQGKEDQLTEMLAWLIDAVPAVGRAVVGLALDDPHWGSEIQVTTQAGIATGRLDAVLLGPSFALVVESKLDSDFHDDQIKRYLDWLEETHGERATLGLLALTKHPVSADQRAEIDGRPVVTGSAHLWEELHASLGSLVESPDQEPLSSRLIEEFLAMLTEEGLIPVPAIRTDELTAWRDAWVAVERFHRFFSECKAEIGAALDAQPITNSAAARAAYVYQDYRFRDGARIGVGIDASDEKNVPTSVARRTPVLWMSVEASHRDDWPAVADRLDAAPPPGWTTWRPRWWGRPIVRRYLDEVIGEGTFEEQRARLAETCAAGADWLRAAEAG
jgi:hypothetical protein